METTSVQLSKIIKKLNRASLEYVLFETLLREAAEQGETPTLERVNKILAMQEQEGGSPSPIRCSTASSSTEASTPAPSSPGKNEPPAPAATPGKDKATWDELSSAEKEAATAIGYNQLGWDEGIPPETCSKRWATLADAERTAASLLGYSGAEWDAELEEELEGEQGAGSGGAAEVAAEQVADALADLGQEMSSMSLGTPAAPSTPAAPAVPAVPARASSAPAPTKAAGLGGPEPARASSAPAVLGKDKEEWASLTAEEQRAATALGFERGMWDEGVAPEKCSLPWAAPRRADTYALGPPLGTYGLRVPASRVGYVPEAQGGLPPGPRVLYVLGTRTSLGRSVRTAYRGTEKSAEVLVDPPGVATVRCTYRTPKAETRTQHVPYVGPWGQAALRLRHVPNAGGWYA